MKRKKYMKQNSSFQKNLSKFSEVTMVLRSGHRLYKKTEVASVVTDWAERFCCWNWKQWVKGWSAWQTEGLCLFFFLFGSNRDLQNSCCIYYHMKLMTEIRILLGKGLLRHREWQTVIVPWTSIWESCFFGTRGVVFLLAIITISGLRWSAVVNPVCSFEFSLILVF